MENNTYLEVYIKALIKEEKKTGTLKQYVSDLQQFILWLDEVIKKDLLVIQPNDLVNYAYYLKKKNLQDITIKRHNSSVNGLLSYYRMDVTVPPDNTGIYRTVPLNKSNFISRRETDRLLKSMEIPIRSPARDALIHRNIAIVYLIRDIGLRPKDIMHINMCDINLAQSAIEVRSNGIHNIYALSNRHMTYIRDYYASIEPLKRPRLKSKDPLFVSFNNRNHDYQYDYEKERPKRLSVRSIQKMIKNEVALAGIRPLSAKHLRNSCILDHIMKNQDEKEIQHYFHLTHVYSLQRYKIYARSESVNQEK